ncbi:MAG TPA: hypothetical protein VHE13_01760 [Opitutus sp.]|nr:hypothetical protein [Opitutus sp.]
MMPYFRFRVRPLLALLAAAGFLSRPASAGYETDNPADPFVQMRTNTGEEMMRNLPDQEFRYDGTLNAHWGIGGVPLFVPPPAPLLGAESSGPPGGFWGLPGTDCALEIFYGGYAILASEHKLSRADIARVAAYRRARARLFIEIKASIDQLAGTAPAVRRAALTELATKQAARLRELQSEAGALWKAFSWAGSTFGYDIQVVTGAPGPEPDAAQSELFLAAYFFDGLSIDQRELLLEMAYKRVLASPHEDADQPTDLFFLPAPARLQLPADLPPAIASRVREFIQQKNVLQADLRRAIHQPHFVLTSTRTRRLAELAEKQAPGFAALASLADEIRVGLADLGFPEQPGDLSLPAGLTQRVGRFYAQKVQLRRELLNRLWSLRNEFIGAKFELVHQGDGLAIAQSGSSGPPAKLLETFNARQAHEYTALAAESAGLRREIEAYLANHPGGQLRSVDQLAADFVTAYQARENANRFRGYQRAVLEPGLSPAQRRLMFSAALTAANMAPDAAQP